MIPPPIRYPLPTLAALLVGALAAIGVERATRDWRAAVADRARRAIEGPPVPHSPRPQVVAGPILRRGLLLAEPTEVFDRPKGPATRSIDRRIFVDIYDAWPDPSAPDFLRVGNRSPIGWIAAAAALEWNTRVVVRPDPSLNLGTDHACPIVGFDPSKGTVELVIWDAANPWSKVARRASKPLAEIPDDALGVWVAQAEIPALLRFALDEDPKVVRLRAILGRFGGDAPTSADVEAARAVLPPPLFRPTEPKAAVDRLAQANARPVAEATWSGLSFRTLPIADLP